MAKTSLLSVSLLLGLGAAPASVVLLSLGNVNSLITPDADLSELYLVLAQPSHQQLAIQLSTVGLANQQPEPTQFSLIQLSGQEHPGFFKSDNLSRELSSNTLARTFVDFSFSTLFSASALSDVNPPSFFNNNNFDLLVEWRNSEPNSNLQKTFRRHTQNSIQGNDQQSHDILTTLKVDASEQIVANILAIGDYNNFLFNTVSVLFQKALSPLEQNSATLPSENNDSNSPPSSPRKNITSDGDGGNLDTIISEAVPEPREIGGMITSVLMLGGFTWKYRFMRANQHRSK
ncbi:MAG: hypothetical protein VKL42_18240 [Snowella sp.]|nr:hypothetical protein [Snowella sp.]